MKRWANEDVYRELATSAAERQGLPAALVLAVIATETGGTFNPNAIRQEVKIGDASRGLMQILYATAKGLGYTGTPEGLFDPATNIDFGTRYLAQQLGRAGTFEGAASAYNGGWRPELGLGEQADHAFDLCLARDQKTGKCIKTRHVQPGEFGNQPYVDSVMGNFTYFLEKEQAQRDSSGGILPSSESGQVNYKLLGVLVGILLALLGLRGSGR